MEWNEVSCAFAIISIPHLTQAEYSSQSDHFMLSLFLKLLFLSIKVTSKEHLLSNSPNFQIEWLITECLRLWWFVVETWFVCLALVKLLHDEVVKWGWLRFNKDYNFLLFLLEGDVTFFVKIAVRSDNKYPLSFFSFLETF